MSDIDLRYVQFAWMGTAIIVAIVLAAAAVTIVSQKNTPPQIRAEIALQLIKAGSIVRLVTIMAIVIAVSLLCAFGQIKGEAAVATLSAIAGYVLGSERAARVDRREDNSN
jgi:uncharacterized membrane protein YedE/YeeE